MKKTYQIKNRFTNAVMFEYTVPDDQVGVNQSKLIGLAVRKALESGADLGDAYLRDADLNGVDLRGAYMRGVDLGDADLRGAYMGGADLRDAYLRDADLNGVDLRDADLRGAYLRDAYMGGVDLRDADLSDADLRDAYLGGADLRGAYMGGVDLRDADLRDAYLGGADLRDAYMGGVDLRDADLRDAYLGGAYIFKIKNIDAAILAAIEAPGNELRMSSWHTCGTTHCRAGWAIHLAGDAGYKLEKVVGSAAAGALIYAASRPDKPVPDFLASDADALADLRACAAEAA
jgi:uncharacterized protein YjbI with pentapeptide repeats